MIFETTSTSPLLSVCVITYNHDKYIKRALDSILSQVSSFEIEIVIGEDCSIDQTRTICENYAAKYPNQINLLPSNSNLGMQANFLKTLKSCRGKYIAICEGDDFWTDINKLQKQVDFLEKNKNYVLTFHNVNKFDLNTLTSTKFNNLNIEKDYTVLDVIQNWIIGTQSMVFRNIIDEFDFPVTYFQYLTPDRFLQILLSSKGLVKYFPEIMGTYCVNEASITVRLNYGKSYLFYNNVIGMFTDLKKMLSEEYEPALDKMIYNLTQEGYMARAIEYGHSKSRYQMIKYLFKVILLKPSRLFTSPRLFLGILKNSF